MLLSVIIPVFNESTNIDELISRLDNVFNKLNINYEIIFSADPCTDDTIEKILSYRENNSNIKLIKMSRRFGQPAATLAGLASSRGDCIVFMDADLQDPPEVLVPLFNKFKDGYDVVHAKRIKRLGENPLRLLITHIGYKVINSLSTTSIPRNVGDFKIISRRVANEILKLRESNIFIKGLVSFVGFSQTSIDYIRESRFSGNAHYSQLWGSIPQALNGIYCYSNKPLHFLSILGFTSASISFLLITAFIIFKLSGAPIASGITSVLVLISFFGGLILFSIGVLGEYIGRIYEEVKLRPKYIIEKEYL
jgi:glycosyltransferase involved in cell wall biosynthesis